MNLTDLNFFFGIGWTFTLYSRKTVEKIPWHKRKRMSAEGSDQCIIT